MIKLFIEYGADVNCSTSSGDTPLHLALNENDFELAQLFIERGANPYILFNDNKYPVTYPESQFCRINIYANVNPAKCL